MGVINNNILLEINNLFPNLNNTDKGILQNLVNNISDVLLHKFFIIIK